MIAPYFLPRRRVGALRPFKFAIHLRDFGWDPHIITIASDGTLTEKEEQLLDDISVYKLTPPFDRTGRSGSQLTQSKSDRNQSTFSVSEWIDKHFPVDTWFPFFRFKFGDIKEIARDVDPDGLWSTGDPWSAHWVGKKLAAIFPEIFWMADFRDPWTLSETDLKKRSAFASAIDQRVEENWIQKASMLSFTTKSTRNLYERHYSELNIETTTIYNAFDRDFFDDTEEKSSPVSFDSNKLHLVFFGRFRKLSTAQPVINVLNRLRQIESSVIEQIEVHSFGPLTDSDRSSVLENNLEDCFVIHKPVPAEQSLLVLREADILLLSTNPERRDIIPAKLWDYLSAGRPILSIAPNPEIKQILQSTGTGTQIPSKKADEVVQLLLEAIRAKQRGGMLPIPFETDQEEINQYSAQSATKKLANIFDQHTA